MSIINAILEDREYTEAQTLADLIETLSKTTGGVEPVDTSNTLELNPYQSDFLTSPDRGFDEILYSGAVGCLSGDCRIWTANGLERMDDLYRRGEPFLVWSMGRSGIPSLEWSTAPFIRGREPLMRVDLEGGRSFRCAGKHRVQLASHDWAEMREVLPGDRLRSIGGDSTALAVIGVSIPSSTPEVYYDLTVEATANYIGEWGIVHHNCGKSMLLCIALLRYVSKPNTPVLLCRYNLSDLKKSTLKMLLEPETQRDGSIREPLLPVQAIKSYNKSESIIYLHNGSQIILCGVSDVEKIRSINCAAAFGEEVSEFSEEMWTAVQQRCRVPCALPNTFMAATNPKHKGHFLYRRFFEDGVPSRRVITVSAYSNKYLSAAYIRQLESLPEPERSKMLLGEWVDTSSAVFPTFVRSHVRDCSNMPEEAFSSFLVSQDYGGGAGFCGAVLLGVGKDGLIYCLDELYKKSQTHSNMLTWMEPYRRQSNSTVVYDSANAALRLDMENAGWKCIPCIKDIEGSIGIVNDRFNSNNLVISDKCTSLISHLENAARDPRTGVINKLKAWDVIDAFRYGICALSTSMKEQLVEQPGMLYYIP